MNKITMDHLRSTVSKIRGLLNEIEILMRSEDRCYLCGKVQTEKQDIAFVREYGFCQSCDTQRMDAERQIYDEVNDEQTD